MPVRSAEAQWEGSLKDGKGQMRLGGGAYEGPYSFASRFEEGSGTNPEELIGAAEAGCFSMFLSGQLTNAGHPPNVIRTRADVHLDKTDDGFSITRIDLHTEAEVPGIDEAGFQAAVEESRKGCPVSRLLKAADITVDATLL